MLCYNFPSYSISPKHAHIKYLTSHRNKDISAQHEHGGSSFEPPEDPGMVYVDYIIIGVVAGLVVLCCCYCACAHKLRGCCGGRKDEYADVGGDYGPMEQV